MCRSAGWRGAAVRGSDDGPAAAAGAREDPRTYRLRPCRRNEPTHRTAREVRVSTKSTKIQDNDASVRGKRRKSLARS